MGVESRDPCAIKQGIFSFGMDNIRITSSDLGEMKKGDRDF